MLEGLYTLCPQKVRHEPHGGNSINFYRIFKTLSLADCPEIYIKVIIKDRYTTL